MSDVRRKGKYIGIGVMAALVLSLLTSLERDVQAESLKADCVAEVDFLQSGRGDAIYCGKDQYARETTAGKEMDSVYMEQGAALKITKKTWKKTLKTKKGETYMTFSYQYPVIQGNSRAAKKVNTFYKKARKKWYAGDEEYRKEAKELCESGENRTVLYYDDDVSCNVAYYGDYISILQNGCIDFGGPHPTNYRMSHIFSAKTGKEVSAMQILGKTKKEINKKVREKFNKLYQENPDAFFEKEYFLDGLKTDFAGKKLYYLYEKKGKKLLVFYAEQYLLAPYETGIIEVELPVE